MEFDVKEIAKWLEQSVKDMQETDWSGCWYKLDNGLGICIYWCDGWGDEPRDDVIQDKEHPDYGLVCGIKLVDENDQSGGGPYFWKFPYFENGEVATEDTGIVPNENFEELAKQMLADFDSVKDLDIDEDGLIHKGEPAPAAEPEAPAEGEVEEESYNKKNLIEKKVKIVSVEQGTCPYCNSMDVEYGAAEFEDDMIHYPAHCNECGRDFEEWYSLSFVGHNVGNDLNTEAEVGKEVEMDESCGKKPLKETWDGESVIDDLIDRAQSMLNDGGYGDAEDCVRQAIDEGLIYTSDIHTLLEHYGSIDDSTIIESYYDDLFSDVLNGLEEPEEEEEEDEFEDDYEPEESHWDGDLEDEEDGK